MVDPLGVIGSTGLNGASVLLQEHSPGSDVDFAGDLVDLDFGDLGFKFGVHPHMLRHSYGYKLANDGHDRRSLQAYLGRKNILHTVRYSEMSPTRFKDFWRD